MTTAAAGEQYETLERQAHAARLGMWVFLASEVLLFAALFALYAAYRAGSPDAFRAGVHENEKLLGSLNTAVLLSSSILAAGSVHALRARRRGLAGLLVAGTIALAGAFLAIKATEYMRHFEHGIVPGGAHSPREFWTLYYVMTGLHALHVLVGIAVLGVLLLGIVRGKVTTENAHRLEVGTLYWHLVDVFWIFLWPMFYLA